MRAPSQPYTCCPSLACAAQHLLANNYSDAGAGAAHCHGRCRTVPTTEQARLISEQLRRQQQQPGQPLLVLGQPQRKEIVEREVGPVVVRVLNAQQAGKPSQAARDFLQQRLQAGVKRSADMLKPARSLQPAHMAQQQWRQASLTAAAPLAKRRR